MNLLRNWRAYLPKGERLYLLLGGLFIALLALALFVYVALALVPNVRIRGELIGVVATAEQALQAEVAAQAAAPATLQAQIATAQAQVDEAAAAFLSETQAVEALDRLYQYARESGVTIVELQAQPAPEPEAVEGVSSLIAFGLRMTGEAPRLMNFLARLRETALSGFVITNVNIAEEEDESVASMNVALYTSPYAAGAITQTITGFVTLPVLPRLTLAFPTPGVLTPMLTQTVLALTTPTVVNPTATSASLVVAPTAPLAPAPVPMAGCINLLNNGDFELEGSWLFGQALTPAQVTTAQHHGGARAMQLGNPPTAGMLNRSSYSSVRQLVTIPANATVATLRWWHLYGTGEPVVGDPGGGGERQELLLLTPAERPLAVIQRVRRNDSDWQQAAVDLTAYRGQSFYVYFNVFNDGGGTPTWMYLDDVQLESCTGAIPAPTTTSAPFVTATNTPIVIAPATNTPTTPPTTAATPTTPPTATALPPAAGCTNLVVNGDFETDGGWLLGQAMIPPQFTTDQRHSGARAVQLGSPPAAGASTRGSYSSIRQLVTIPANAGGVTLRWWHLYGTAEAATTDPGTTSDRQEVLLLTPDEKVLAVVQRVRRNDSGWQQETADLTAYRGRSVYLYFNVYNNGNGAATWAYVDDVQLDACTGVTPAPTTTTLPTATATGTPIATPTVTHTPVTPVAPTTTPGTCVNLLTNGGFESDGDWFIGPSALPAQITTSQQHAGARAMQLGNPPGVSAGNTGGYSSIRQLVTIPADAGTVTLRWWHLYGTQEIVTAEPGTAGDRQEVLLLLPDERPLAVVQRVRRNENSWQEEAVDLTAYRGQNVYVYFNVFNDGNSASTWMYVDDVQLEVCSTHTTPVPTLTSVGYTCMSDAYNCSDFSTQTAAQQIFDYCSALGHGDVHRLDQDNDGIACE